MIVFSFLLVLAALGLLVVGLLGASQVLVWGSIAASAVAGLCLVLAVVQQRRSGYGVPADDLADADYQSDAPTSVITPVAGEPARAPAHSGPPVWQYPAGPDQPADGPVTDSPGVDRPTVSSRADGPGEPAMDRRAPDQWDSSGQPDHAPDAVQDPPDEPVEETVSAADLLRTADLSYDVLVVDGRPRYHLVDCSHLRHREPVSLPLAEARESGFTPCSRCRPDSTLAGRHRERFGD